MIHKLLFISLFLIITPVAFAGDYVIGEGDGLDVAVWGVKELNVTVKVRPDGKITIPGLGDVPAAGYTPTTLQVVLADKLKELVKKPLVTVTVREITNSKVYILVGGTKSTVYELNRKTTLLHLLCTLGDTKAVDLRKAYVLRGGKKLKEDFHKLFTTGDPAEDVNIEANDSIFIPLILDRNIYVLGAVATPKFIEYREGITVMEAILEAGGFTKFAKQNNTSVLRKEEGKEITIPVKAKDLLNDGDLTQNVKLKPGDYVIVKEGMF